MASSVATLATSKAWLSRPMPWVAITRARAAASSGIRAAKTAPPKTMSRMTRAASTPTPTDSPVPEFSELVMDWPPREMWTLAPSADSAAAIRFLASVLVTLADFLSHVTVAKATVPSRLIWAAPSLV